GRPDAIQQGLLAFRGLLLALDRLVEQLAGIILAVFGGFQAVVQQHHLYVGLGRGIGDAGAHHAGAEYTYLADLGWRDALRARLALVDGVQLEPQGADHVLGDRRQGAVDEVARFDFATGIEIDDAAFEYAAHDVGRRRIIA